VGIQKSSERERSEWGITEKSAPLPVEREESRARVREQVSSARALPHAVVNPHAKCPHPWHCRRQIQIRRAGHGVRVLQSLLCAEYPRFFGHRIARTTCLCLSCVPIPKRKNGRTKRRCAPGGKGDRDNNGDWAMSVGWV
jgi:hypothetical protein